MKRYPIWRVKTQRNNATTPWNHYFKSREEAQKFYNEKVALLEITPRPYIAIYAIEYIGAFNKENAEFLLGCELE